MPFKTVSDETIIARNWAIHEYPYRETSYAEDLSKKTTEYQVFGFVCGDDVDEQRSNLIKALLKKGAGKLVHPEKGRLL